jgi:NSS family neurotransmitter:Na+ symporter
MPLGQLWCTLFFVFLSFAALSTVIAVFENIIAFSMDQWGMSRGKSTIINGILLIVLALPCALGFNVWSGFTIPGIGDIQGIEDFIVSNNILPLGGLIFAIYCTSKIGWGWDNFLEEVNTGKGIKFPKWLRVYMTYILPAVVVFLLVQGYIAKF